MGTPTTVTSLPLTRPRPRSGEDRRQATRRRLPTKRQGGTVRHATPTRCCALVKPKKQR